MGAKDDDTGTEATFDPGEDILPDDLVEKHYPKPAALDDDGDADDDDDTLEDEDPDDDADDDEDEAGEEELEEGHEDSEADEDEDDDLDDEEDDEEGEEEDVPEDEDSDDAEDEEDVLETPSAEERKAIEKNPTLRKIHKLMQRDYTRKTTEVSARERAVETRAERLDSFEKAVRSPKGMVQFLTKNLRDHMDVVGPAFEAVATGQGGFDFLVEVGLHSPEMFRKAADRVDELESDETEKSRHVRARDAKSDEERVKRDRLKLAQERFDTASGKLMSTALRVAKSLRVHKDDLEDVRAAVLKKIDEKVRQDGSIAFSPAEVKKVVKKAKREIDARLDRAERRLASRTAAGRRGAVKKKAGDAKKKRVVPRRGSTGSRGVGSKRASARAARGKVPEGVDPLDYYLDKRTKDLRL